ncbi:twin-arginine translocation signal domain-containing protein [Nonomuraea zeae]|uniref:Twin-arginine translocation signal domain-containing protein n=1 Tax=Nonomuraea zeae TaxID=1642303 RepID=A0A5S4GW78_9ACTN|nr:twin-arginine translocation signal domain-containing protein [Nonomuraea zeae]TMR37213.1 twin-arginine translocation signal domain-containing protein [Nonomuraea zeae]
MDEQSQGTWQHTRRRFLKGTLIGAGAMSISVMDQLGGAQPAEAGPPTCFDPSGFQYRGGVCAPASYTTNCSKGGCYREGLTSHPINCPSRGAVYKERHRTCGEDVTYNGTHKQFTLRLNECGGNWDGWEWIGTDTDVNCGCTTPYILWSCNDGYVRVPSGGGWSDWIPSICMTDVCWDP